MYCLTAIDIAIQLNNKTTTNMIYMIYQSVLLGLYKPNRILQESRTQDPQEKSLPVGKTLALESEEHCIYSSAGIC